MDFQQANKLSIVDFLEKRLGIDGMRYGNDNIMYPAPYREDKTPSLSVNPVTNKFKDFGSGFDEIKGGFVNLIMAVYHLKTRQEALNKINEIYSSSISSIPLFVSPQNDHQQSSSEEPREEKIRVIETKELYYYPLKNNIQRIRKLDLKIAEIYLKEVHFKFLRGKNLDKIYYGTGMQNLSEGWEISFYNRSKNEFLKTVAGHKDIIYIQGIDKNTRKLLVFEAYFDFLAHLTMEKRHRISEDVIIMTAITLEKRTVSFINENQYQEVYFYLDNDEQGKGCLLLFKDKKQYINSTIELINRSQIYAQYKDVNEWLVSRN